MTKQLEFFDQNKETWLKLARQTAENVLREKGEVCADDIHRLLPAPRWIDGRIMGSVFRGMKLLRYKKSERRECHYRPIGVFSNG